MSNQKPYKDVRALFAAYLENKGLRKTPERFAVLKTIYSLDGHFDVELLYATMKRNKARVSRATVYNTLDLLMECGMVARHRFEHTMAQYEKSFGHRQHDHFICTRCNRVVEFCDPRLQSVQKTVEELFQVDVQHHSLVLYVTCNKEDCESRK